MAAGHRRAGVDEEGDGEVLLLDEQLDEQPLEPGVDVPVELAQVVAEGVVAVVGELHGLAPLDAPAAALEAAPDGRADEQQEALELAQEPLVEHGRVELGGRKTWRVGRRSGTAAGRCVAHGLGAGPAIRRSPAGPRRGSCGRPPRS